MTKREIEITKKHYAPCFKEIKGSYYVEPEMTAHKIAMWSQEFFGDPVLKEWNQYYIQGNVPDFHINIYMDLMSPFRLYYITAPSEFSKTTCCTFIYPLYQLVYFNEPYTVLSGRVEDTSVAFLDAIKDAVTENPKFISIYGKLKPENTRDSNFMWQDHHVRFSNGCQMSAIQVGGNVRSRRRGQWRITLFIIDDPEEIADLDSPKTLIRNKRWVKRTVEKRLDKNFGKFRVVGTRIGEGCTIEEVMKDTRWRGRVYTALVKDKNTGKERSIWEERWSTAFLINERTDAIRNNELADWNYERMNEPSPDSLKTLQGYLFHNLIYRRFNNQNCLVTGDPQDSPIPVNIYCSVDPAYKMDSIKADQRAVIIYALGQQLAVNEFTGNYFPKNCCWILEYLYNYMDPSYVLDAIMGFHKKYYLNGSIIETIGGAQLYEFFQARMLAADPFYFQHPFAPTYVSFQKQNKVRRIHDGLNPRIKQKALFLRDDHYELRKEMDEFKADKLHLCDALELGLRHSIVNTDTVINVSNERQELARESRQHLTAAEWKRKRYGVQQRPAIPTNLSQIFGARRQQPVGNINNYYAQLLKAAA